MIRFADQWLQTNRQTLYSRDQYAEPFLTILRNRERAANAAAAFGTFVIRSEVYDEIKAMIARMYDEARDWCEEHCRGRYRIDRTKSFDRGFHFERRSDREAFEAWQEATRAAHVEDDDLDDR